MSDHDHDPSSFTFHKHPAIVLTGVIIVVFVVGMLFWKYFNWTNWLLIEPVRAEQEVLKAGSPVPGMVPAKPKPVIPTVTVLIDPQNGCQYVIDGRGGMERRFGRDGKQICEAP